MRRYPLHAAALLLWLLAPATLLAQANPLDVIPDDTLGFVAIKNLADANARVQSLTEKMKIPVPELLPMAKGFFGIQEGLDENGGIAAAAFADKDGADLGFTLVVFVPVTDYKAFITQLAPDDASAKVTEVTVMGEKFLAAKKGSFALLGAKDKRAILEKVVTSSKSVTPVVAPLKSWMERQQATVVLTPAGKKMLVAKLLALFPDPAKLKDDAKDDDDQQPISPAQAKEMLELAKELLKSADEQLTHAALGVRIDDDTALHVAVRLAYTPGGALARWSQKVKLPSESLLKGLPPGKYAVAYGGVSVPLDPNLNSILNRFTEMGLQQFGLDEDGKKKLEAALNKQSASRTVMSGLLGLVRPGDSIFSTALSVERVKDARQHIKAAQEAFEVLQEGLKNADTDEPFYELKQVKVGDLDTLEVTTNMAAVMGAVGEDNPQAAQMKGVFGMMFGGEGKIKAYTAAANDRTVVTAYSKENLQRAVAQVRSGGKGLEADPQIAKTNELLPEGSQWVAYVSPQGLLQWVESIMRTVTGGQLNMQLPRFPESEPIGLAGHVDEKGMDGELVLPASVVAGIGQFVGMVQQMFQGGGVPLP